MERQNIGNQLSRYNVNTQLAINMSTVDYIADRQTDILSTSHFKIYTAISSGIYKTKIKKTIPFLLLFILNMIMVLFVSACQMTTMSSGKEITKTYTITRNGTLFTATNNDIIIGTDNQPIQTVIDGIRNDIIEKEACVIQFETDGNILDIGIANVTFSGADWGVIELTGEITSTGNPTIAINDSISIKSTANIINTLASNRAISNNSTGTITISGGVVSAISGYGVYNFSSGEVIISGGNVSTTNGNAVYNNGAGKITISGGEVSATGSGGTVYNYSTGTITISGGEVHATGTGGFGIFNLSTGLVNISGGTVSVTDPSGYAVYNSGTGTVTISSPPAIIIGLTFP